MYRKDHIAIANAVRSAGIKLALPTSHVNLLAEELAAVCKGRTAQSNHFDEDMFFAYALRPDIPVPDHTN